MYNIHSNKQYLQKTGLIQRLINITPSVDWCYCGTEVLFEIVSLFAVLKLVFHGKFLAIQQSDIG